jgi:hypothetical protein
MKTSSMSSLSLSAFQLIGRALLRLQLSAPNKLVSGGGATEVANGKLDGDEVDARLAAGSSAYTTTEFNF